MHQTSHIAILMAVRDGAQFLPEQLHSIAAQTWQDWTLIISDDGSRDDSVAICRRFADDRPQGQVRLVEGPRRGATANFLSLLGEIPESASIAFCDQDDVWLPEKLRRAADQLSGVAGPAHYSARTLITDPALEIVGESPRFRLPFGLRNALVQACTAGNTSVFNPEAASILKAGADAADRAGIVSHDWWAYQLISGAGGAILKDDEPVLKYRQHSTNEMGRNDTAREKLRRLSMLFAGSFGRWLLSNHRALADATDLLTPTSRDTIERFGKALAVNGPAAAKEFARLGLYRHDRPGTIALYAAAATGRLRQRR